MSIDLPQLKTPALTEQPHFDARLVLAALDEDERQQALAFAGQIDPTKPSELAAYGAAEQGSLRTWLDLAVRTVAQQDLGQGKQAIEKLLDQLRDWERLCAPRRFLFFGGASFPRLRAAYQQVDPAIEQAASNLLDESIALRRTNKVLERMAQENEAHLLRLSTYLLCGHLRLQALRAPAGSLTQNETQGSPVSPSLPDAGENQMLDRLERRLHDLALTRQVNLQTRVQVALLIDGNEGMIDTMERTLRHTLPLWKAQVLVALGLSAQAEAMRDTQRAQQALKSSAAKTGAAARGLARQMRRPGAHADRSALQQSNQTLMAAFSTLQAALSRQQEQSERIKNKLHEPLIGA